MSKKIAYLFFSLALVMGAFFGIAFSEEKIAPAFAFGGEVVTITANDKTQVYGEDFVALDYTISGETLSQSEIEELDIRLIKEEGGDVGEYEITVVCNASDTYDIQRINGIYTIIPAVFDTRDLFFENKTYTYDGTVKSLALEGFMPSEIDVSYVSNNQSQAGQYLVSAVFACNSGNYTIEGGTAYATLIIEKAIIDISGIVFEDKTFIYDGEPKNLAVTGDIPETVSVRYQGNLAQTVGRYRVTAILDYNKNNYKLFNGDYEMEKNNLYAEIIINKAKSVINVEENLYKRRYDGTPFVIPYTLTGEEKRNAVFIINNQLGSNRFIDVGNYFVRITTIGTANYLPAEEVTVEINVLSPVISMQNEGFNITLISQEGFKYGADVVVTKNENALIDTEENAFRKLAGVYTVSLLYEGEILAVPEGTTIVITPPNGRNLRLYYNENGLGKPIEFTYNGQNEIVFQPESLGMFVIYADDYQLYWIIGLIICIAAMLALTVIIVIYRSKTYKISFVTNIIGYELKPIIGSAGIEIDIPDASFGSLIFDGWHLEDTLNSKLISLKNMPDKNIVLYAKWAFRPIGKYRKFTDLDLF